MRVTPPDLTLWLITYVRATAAAEGVTVSVAEREPDTLQLPLARPLIVIRDDSGSRTDVTTFDRSIGATVIGGAKQNSKPINDLARWLAGVLFDHDIALADGSPIAAVVDAGCNGPYPVADQLDVVRMYSTAQYVVTGSW